MYCELCGLDGIVLQQNNILQQVIQEVHHDFNLHGTINEQQENIGQIIKEIYRLREELVKLKLTLRQGLYLLMKLVLNIPQHWKVYSHLQVLKLAQVNEYMKPFKDYPASWGIFNVGPLNWKEIRHWIGGCKLLKMT